MPTKAEALAWAREQEALIDSGGAQRRPLNTATLATVLVRYISSVTPRKRSSDSEASRLQKMLRAPLCCLTLAELQPKHIAAYRDERLKAVKPGTVRRELSLLRNVLEIASREWGLEIALNPVDRVSRPIANDARERRLQSGELRRLLVALEATRNELVKPLIHFAIETALRRGELLNLQWRHVDLIARTGHVPTTKSGHPRTIPLTDGAIQLLEGLPRTDERVFPITAVALRHAWVRLCARAGISDLRLHDLRHEAISRFAEMGLNMPELALISGHRDYRMLQRYTHLRPTDLARKLAGRRWEQEVAIVGGPR
jgi:integrase